jgi:DNA-binding NtrC family response regulator
LSEREPEYRVLVVEDEEPQRRLLLRLLEEEGYSAVGAATGEEGLRLAGEEPPDLVVLDLHLPDADGDSVLRAFREKHPWCEVILRTGDESPDAAFRAGRGGAFAYVRKSADPDALFTELSRACERVRLRRQVRALELGAGPGAIIGKSVALGRVLETVDRVARSSAKVLITGENGTGKDLVARRLHALSKRAQRTFVKLNCAAIPRDLVESELFGHEKGAFTGALASRRGKLEQADGGTLFLDEIGDLSLDAQAKLLRAIETGEVERVGGSRVQVVDVRLLAATNKDLQREVAEGRFREDLFFRLNVVPIHVPSLRERPEDVELLARHFLARFADEEGVGEKELAPEALELLRGYRWPGNVRELRNLMERAVLLVDGPNITAADLTPWLVSETGPLKPGEGTLRESLEQQEAEAIRRELEATRWNVTQASARLGLDRTNLHRKMRKYGIRRGGDDTT